MKFPFVPEGDTRNKKWGYEDEAKGMLKYIKDYDVVYDIGANIADHTIFFALNRDINIFSFEPVPEYFELAKKNIDFFQAPQINIYNIGISDSSGKMEIAKNNQGSSFLESEKRGKNEMVRIETIDNLVSNGLKPPNVIKIDIEGWAEFAFKGALKTLKKYKPIIILEPHPIFLDLEKIKSKFKVLEDIGYRITGTVKNRNREFVLQVSSGRTFEDYRSFFSVWIIRDAYDKTSSKREITRLSSEYKTLAKKGDLKIFQRIIWSKLYRFFTGKWINTK